MKQSYKKVSWGVIGAGDVCEVKSAPAMSLIDNSEVVAVMRRNTKKAEDFAHRHGIGKWYDNEDDLLEDPEVNAVYIATPPNSHVSLTHKAAMLGKPVYVEKPMGLTYAECQSMIDVCQKNEVPLFVAYYRRSMRVFNKIHDLLNTGAIGDILQFNIQCYSPADTQWDKDSDNWRVDPSKAGGGYFYDKASHQIDLIDYFFGPVKHAAGFTSNKAGLYTAEDTVSALFQCENGIVGTGNWCFSTGSDSETDITTIIGSSGRIEFPTFSGYYVDIYSDQKGHERYQYEPHKHVQYPHIESIVKQLTGSGLCPCDGITGSRANQVMEKVIYGDSSA